jgi:hypothetical protein
LGQLLLATGARNPISNGGSRGGGLAFILPDANFRTPYSQQWNVQLQQQFGQNFTASIGYVGSTGTKLIRFRTPNMGPNTLGLLRRNAGAQIGFEPTSMASNRPIPELGPFTVIESAASSNYHSLQLSINKRFSDGLQFSSAYTYGQIIDEVSDVFDTAGTFNLPQDNHNLRAERAAAAFDIRHRSITYFNYQLPFFKDNRWFGDYQLAGVLTLQTGQPFTVNVALDANIDGNLTDRPSVAIFQQVDRGINRLVTDITDPESQIAAAIGRNLGNSGFLGRNTQRAPGLASMDLAVIKKFALTDRQTLLIRTEIFNLFNRTHFAVPVRTIGAPAFGRAVSTALPARIIQFAVKYQF